MKTEDFYESYSYYHMTTADKDINEKLDVLRLERGVSLSRFITEAICEKLRSLGCDFSDHSPTAHTRMRGQAQRKAAVKQSQQSGLDQLRSMLFKMDMKCPKQQKMVKQSEPVHNLIRSKKEKSDVDQLRESLFRIQFSGLHKGKGK